MNNDAEFRITVKAFNEAMRAPAFLFNRSSFAAVRLYQSDQYSPISYTLDVLTARVRRLLWKKERSRALFNRGNR